LLKYAAAAHEVSVARELIGIAEKPINFDVCEYRWHAFFRRG